MRARTVASALSVLLTAACGSVPDLRFGDDVDDASVVSVIDSSLPTPVPTSTSGEAGPDSATPPPEDDASITDAAPPVEPQPDSGSDAAATGCPTKAPAGAQCCGSLACRPGGGIGIGGNFCNCTLCPSSCDADGVCCMNHQGGFESCATSVAACPAP